MARKSLIFVINAYKTIISPLIHRSCRFYPSCSSYSVEAIDRHGAIKGLWISMIRILMCNRYFKGGFDPVR